MGTPLTNLFSASCKDGILQDLALQLTRFYTRYRSFKHDKLPALTLSNRSALSEEEIDRFAHQIRQTIDHRKIHYPLCYLGVLCMLVPLLFGRMTRKGLRNALQKPQTLPSFVVLLLCVVATVNCFTSYSLIVLPSSNALLLSLSICFYFLFTKQSVWSCFRLAFYLFISCFRSGSRFFTASLFFLAMVFTSFKNKWLILIQIVLECWYLCCSPSPFLAWSAFFLCFFQSFSASSLLSLFVLLAGTEYAHSLLCFLLVSMEFTNKPSSFIYSFFLILLCLHFTYLVTPSFSFSNIRWSSAFVFTHHTNMAIQALSVASMTFYPFVIICQTRHKGNVQEGVMLIVLSSAISLLINTASPVVWSVYTPLFLFTCVLWFVVFLLLDVCSILIFVMEVASIPTEYFDTKAYFKNKDRQLWQKGFVVGHNGLPIRRRKVKRNMSTKSMFFLSISFVLLFTLTVITILLWTGVITWGYATICPEGFNMPNCERMDFLDTYIWQGNKKYKINNQECYYGVAFRTWAPMASAVSVIFSNSTHTQAYPMT